MLCEDEFDVNLTTLSDIIDVSLAIERMNALVRRTEGRWICSIAIEGNVFTASSESLRRCVSAAYAEWKLNRRLVTAHPTAT